MPFSNKAYYAGVRSVGCGPTKQVPNDEMSSSPPETETYEVTLSRDEQWVVHHVLSNRLTEALEADERPSEWVLEVIETLETGDGTERLTGSQTEHIYDELEAYVDREETPDRDVEHGSVVLERLADVREASD